MRHAYSLLVLALLAASVLASPELSRSDFRGLKRQLQQAAASGDAAALAAGLGELAADDSERAVELIVPLGVEFPAGGVYEAARDGRAW